jgi:hypothetical protein
VARFYTYGDPPALIRRADPDDPPDVPGWSYFDRRSGSYVAYPEAGRSVINGDAEQITPADAARLEERLGVSLGVNRPLHTAKPASGEAGLIGKEWRRRPDSNR